MVRRPRITVDVRLVKASGIGTYLRNVLPRIIVARPGWHFYLMGRAEELGEFPWASAEHVSVVPCNAPIYGIAEQIQLALRIPSDTDLMWSPHYNIPLGYRGRLLVTIHDLCHLALPYLVEGAHRRAYARFMFAALRARANGILCDSEFTKGELGRLVGRPRREPVAVHLGVGEEWFTIRRSERPHAKPFILFVGNVKPHKNLVTLVEAFQGIAQSVPHDLVIVGKQAGFITRDQRVHRAANALGDRIRFTGELAQTSLEQFVAYADAFVFPSLYEGFGLPPLEAMACGCPTVVARAASIPEVCGDASLYFDPPSREELAATLLRVLSDKQVRQELRERGRRHAARFSWDYCAETTLGVLEELVLR
jgi:glycosyltransferase involved in cell wall biosynthesis